MSQPPTDPIGWNPAGWPPPNERGGEPAGPGRPPGQRQASGGWSAANGQQPPQPPRVYGRATPTPTYGEQQSSYRQQSTYGQQPSYGGQQPYGGQQSSYGQQPTYGQPTYPSPYEPPPASGPPAYPAASTAPTGRFGRPGRPQTTLVLVLVAGLLLVLGGVMTGLFFAKSSELSRAERDLAAKVEQIEKLNRDVKTANDRAARTQQDLTGTQNSRKEVERQKQVIGRCLTLLVQAGQAANNGDRSAYEEAAEEAEKVCKEADRYL